MSAVGALFAILWILVRDTDLVVSVLGGVFGVGARAGRRGLRTRAIDRAAARRSRRGMAIRARQRVEARRRERGANRRLRLGAHDAAAARGRARRSFGDWRRSLPGDVPNNFLVNISPEERAPLEEFLEIARLRRAGPVSHDSRPHDGRQRRAERIDHAQGRPRAGDFSSASRISPGPIALMDDNRLIAGSLVDARRSRQAARVDLDRVSGGARPEARRHPAIRRRRREPDRARSRASARSAGTASVRTSSWCFRRACSTAPPAPT